MWNSNWVTVETIEYLMEVSSMVLSLITFYDTYDKQNKLFKENFSQEEEFHLIETDQSKSFAIRPMYTQLENHVFKLNSDLLAMSRESERDMFDQTNNRIYTLILASTLMLGAIVSVIFQGILPKNPSRILSFCYSFFSSISTILLIISIVLFYLIIKKTSNFMYKKSVKYRETLGKIEHLSVELRELHQAESMLTCSDEGLYKEGYSVKELSEGVKSLMEKRKQLNKFLYEIAKSNDGLYSFDNFWVNHCEKSVTFSITLFYIGSFSLIVSIAIYMYCFFNDVHSSLNSSIASIFVFGFSAVASVLLIVTLRFAFSFPFSSNSSLRGSFSRGLSSSQMSSLSSSPQVIRESSDPREVELTDVA